MAVGYDQPLYMLAFDHRGSFRKGLFGITGDPTPEEHEQIADSKQVIYEGFEHAVANGAPEAASGLLVDEEFGAAVARKARAGGYPLAMPVEKSGQAEFDFEFGDAFGDHIEEFDPDFAKVLVRYNPEGDVEMNRRQTARLKKLGDWLHANDRKYLFELLVPAEPHQLEQVEDDQALYDLEIRPDLVERSIKELQEGGVEPDIWKIEGLDRPEDCERVAARARSGGRDGVTCIVLGRGANEERVGEWLRAGAGEPGYTGFAVGRTLWWEPLQSYVDGDLGREQTAETISDNFRRMIDVYAAAAV